LHVDAVPAVDANDVNQLPILVVPVVAPVIPVMLVGVPLGAWLSSATQHVFDADCAASRTSVPSVETATLTWFDGFPVAVDAR
jgi:hypothetical protein